MKKIKLTNNGYVNVDDEDFNFLNQWKWTKSPQGYVARTGYENGEQKKILMHRVIVDPPKELQVDHKNRNKLDNRKSNLRIVTQSENMHNTGNWKNNTSGIKNICFDKSKNKWVARKQYNGKQKFIGRYATIEDAEKALQLCLK